MSFIRRLSFKRTASTRLDAQEDDFTEFRSNGERETPSVPTSKKKSFGIGMKWFSLSKTSKRNQVRRPDQPRPSTPTPYAFMSNPHALASSSSRGARATFIENVEDKEQQEEGLHSIREESSNHDGEDVYGDATDKENDQDEHMTTLERERLSSFASGVRGLIAALQAADEARKACPPLANGDGTPLSPIEELDEPWFPIEESLSPDCVAEQDFEDDSNSTALSSPVDDCDHTSQYISQSDMSETEVDSTHSLRTVTELEFGSVELEEQERKHLWTKIYDDDIMMDGLARLQSSGTSTEPTCISNISLQALDLAHGSSTHDNPLSLRIRVASLPPSNSDVTKAHLRKLFPTNSPTSPLDTYTYDTQARMEKLIGEKARLEQELDGAWARVRDQDIELVALKARIIALQSTMSKLAGQGGPECRGDPFLFRESAPLLGLTTPPTTPHEATFGSKSFAESSLGMDNATVNYESFPAETRHRNTSASSRWREDGTIMPTLAPSLNPTESQ